MSESPNPPESEQLESEKTKPEPKVFENICEKCSHKITAESTEILQSKVDAHNASHEVEQQLEKKENLKPKTHYVFIMGLALLSIGVIAIGYAFTSIRRKKGSGKE